MATSRGLVPLSFGTTAITGYVVENISESASGETEVIYDEDGDAVIETSGFGLKTEVSLSVIPKSTATAPACGDIFTYGSAKFVVSSVDIKKANKGVEKWELKGTKYPGISLS